MFKKFNFLRIFRDYLGIFYDASSPEKKPDWVSRIILFMFPVFVGFIAALLNIKFCTYDEAILIFCSIISPIFFSILFSLSGEKEKTDITKIKELIEETMIICTYLAVVSLLVLIMIIILSFSGSEAVNVVKLIKWGKFNSLPSLYFNWKAFIAITCLAHLALNFAIIAKRINDVLIHRSN